MLSSAFLVLYGLSLWVERSGKIVKTQVRLVCSGSALFAFGPCCEKTGLLGF